MLLARVVRLVEMLIVSVGATSFQCGLRPAVVTRHGQALMSDPELEALARLDTLKAQLEATRLQAQLDLLQKELTVVRVV